MKVKNSQTKKILEYMAVGGGIVALSLANPLLPHQLLKKYTKGKRIERAKFFQDLKRLQSRKLIEMNSFSDGTINMRLLNKGKEVVLRENLERMKIERPKKWDKKWRLVMFDIPSNKNKERDALRMKLKEMQFYQLQRSVFLFPFSCGDAIDTLGVFFGVRDYIVLMNVSDFEGEEKLRRYFKL